MQASILVVEDDTSTAKLIQQLLAAEHHTVAWARSVLEARSLFRKGQPDLVILDRNLPDKDGLEFCKELRAAPESQAVPILFLTGKRSLSERVVGLKMGGDEYLTKPFHADELMAHVEAILRRTMRQPEATGVLQLGPVRLSLEGRIAQLGNKELALTLKEFDVLRTFVERPNRVLSRQFLLSHVWGYGEDVDISTRAVDMMIVGLRKKLGKWGDSIESVKSLGYRLRGDG